MSASHRETVIEDAPYIASPLPFPFEKIPEFYCPPLEDEPEFDAAKHLALPFQLPDKVWTLSEFGYQQKEVAECPSDVAVTSAFRLLSEQGVKDLREVCLKLHKYHQTHSRTADFVRGGVYRSKFLRDLCLSKEVTDFVSQIANAPLAPHTMPLQLGHINYAPQKEKQTIDKWHTDTVEFVLVVLLTDPSTFEGGRFQFFRGVANEARNIAEKNNNMLPDELVESPVFPNAGYAVFQQGSKVCHRAEGLSRIGERITMVNSYVSRDMRYADGCRIVDLKGEYNNGYDPQDVLFSEWTRHKAWRAKSKLDWLMKTVPITQDSNSLCRLLKDSVEDIRVAISDLSDGSNETELHFGN